MQVSAHGTGAGLPPVDEQVVALKLVTPGEGTLNLSLQVQLSCAAQLAWLNYAGGRTG